MSRSAKQVSKTAKARTTRRLLTESLEPRQLMAVDTTAFDNGILRIWADDTPTRAAVSQVGSMVRITEGATIREVETPGLSQIRFYGGASGDYFKTLIPTVRLVAFGGAGNDEIHGSGVRDVLRGDEGDDKLYGWGGSDDLHGGDGIDTLNGNGGNDRLYGDNGIDTLRGGVGDDQLWGGLGDDHLYGEDNNDILDGQDGADHLHGGSGNDVLKGGYGIDRLYGGSGNDHLDGQFDPDYLFGESDNDVLIGIDSAYSDDLTGGSGRDVIWRDSVGNRRDDVLSVEAIDKVHSVSGFANGADRTLNGDRIADPALYLDKFYLISPIEYARFDNLSLFADNGPSSDDVNQGFLGDCWALAAIGEAADTNPQEIRNRIVDFRDGTYGVALGDKFYRVDNDLPVWRETTSPAYAGLGQSDSMWVAVFEKALAHFRTGENSYASLDDGAPADLFAFIGGKSIVETFKSAWSTGTAFLNDLTNRINSGLAVVFSTSPDTTTSSLFGSHAYIVVRIGIENGKTHLVLRNPHGGEDAEVRIAVSTAFLNLKRITSARL